METAQPPEPGPGPAEAFEKILKQLDSPYMQMAIRERVETLTHSYLKKLAGLSAIAFGLAGYLGYTQIANLKDAVKEQKEQIEKQLKDAGAQVNERVAALHTSVAASQKVIDDTAETIEAKSNLLSERVDSVNRQAAAINENVGRAQADANRSASMVTQSGQAVADALRLNAEIAKLIPASSEMDRLRNEVQRLTDHGQKLVNQANTLSERLAGQLNETVRLRSQLNEAQNLNADIRKAATIQLVALRSKGRKTRTITLPSVVEGKGPVEMRLSIPSGLSNQFVDLDASAVGYAVDPLKGLEIGKPTSLGNTGYKVEVEFIYHDLFANDFALLKIQPVK